MRKEKDFCTEFNRSLTTLRGNVFYHKIADCGYTNPFDSVMCYDNKFYGLEMKLTKNKYSFSLASLFTGREHQLVNLKKVEEAGGSSLILINVFEPRKTNYIIALSYMGYVRLLNYMNFKTIKFDDPYLKRVSKRIYKNDVGYWSLNKIFDND